MNPEQLMSATDEEIREYENSLLNSEEGLEETPSENKTEEENTPQEESTIVEDKVESPEDDVLPPNAIMSMTDEEFEKYEAENNIDRAEPEEPEFTEPKVEDNDKGNVPASKPVEQSTPTIEELREKALKAEQLLEQNKTIIENRELVEALDVNGLLSPDKVNQLIGVAKGDKKAILTLLEANGIDVSSLTGESKEAKKDTKESKDPEGTDEDDLFDSWLNGDDDSDKETKTPKEKPELKKPEDTTTTPETPSPEQEQIDYLDQIATNKVGAVATEIITTYGQEVLDAIDSNIDVPSFEMLKKSPEDLKALAEQKQSGVMDIIHDQISKMEASGIFPPNVPYLTKYHLAGNLLIEQNNQPAQPIDRRVKAPASTVDPKLKHTQSSTASTSTKSESSTVDPYNIFTMSEEEFNRLK